jgi:hypothetical protein
LDLGLFGELKGRYQSSSRKLTRPQWQGKVLRIDRAWYVSTYALNIRNSWGVAAMRPSTGEIPQWHVDAVKIEAKIAEHCRWEELTEVIQAMTSKAEQLRLYSGWPPPCRRSSTIETPDSD